MLALRSVSTTGVRNTLRSPHQPAAKASKAPARLPASGTTGEAAARHGRRFLLIDSNPEAVRVMAARLAPYGPELVGAADRDADAGPGG